MALPPEDRLIYHITDVENLPGILEAGGLLSDQIMSERNPLIIGYDHIKRRRLEELRVPCAGNRFVGSTWGTPVVRRDVSAGSLIT